MDFFTALKQNINEYIVANGNKEITADILRPILLEICNITFDKMGDLELLETVYKEDLVGAINEALNADSGVKIHYGDFPNPNDAEIPNFELGDFYAQQGDTGIVSFWQYNGQKWVKIADSGGGGGDAVWGSITGNIANQTDLMDEFDKKINKSDLEIGGRNYLPNFHSPEWDIDSGVIIDRYSLHFPANSGNPTAEIILYVESNANYTFTFNSDYARYAIREYNGGVGDVIVSGSEPEITFNTGSFTKIRLNIDTGSGNRDKDRNVSNLKLEKGNVATDWTPALEDQVTDWNETDEDSFSFLKNKPTIPDEFDPAEHDLDEFQNESTDPYVRTSDIPPAFDPSEHDLDEFKNQSTNPFARMDDLPEPFHPDDYDLAQFNNESSDPYVRSSELPAPFDPTYLEDEIADLSQNKQDKLNFTPESVENKVETLADPDNVTYPTTKAVADAIDKKDIIRTSNTLINAGWSGHDIITNGYTMTVNPTSMDYPDSFEVYLYNNTGNDSAIVLNAKTGVTYTVIDNDVSSATVFLQAYGTAVFKRIGNTQNYILRGYII